LVCLSSPYGYYVLGEHLGSVYTGHQMIAAVGPGRIVCADHLDYTVPLLRRPQFRIFIWYILHALCHFATRNLCPHVRQYTALLFYII